MTERTEWLPPLPVSPPRRPAATGERRLLGALFVAGALALLVLPKLKVLTTGRLDVSVDQDCDSHRLQILRIER